MGIEIQKEWVCTHDDRTRSSHLELDGERRDLDEEFSNGLQYPGDPDGDPSEVYNCRCTMVAYLPGIDSNTKEASLPEEEYEKWVDDKTEEQKAQATEAMETTVAKIEKAEVERVPNKISASADKQNITYRGVHRYETLPTEEQMISNVAGLDSDKHRGACTSKSLAYAGEKCGFAVKDNRGGVSREFFATEENWFFKLVKCDGVKATYDFSGTPLESFWKTMTEKLAGKANLNKEYIFGAGGHATIIKRTGSKTYKYLELQNIKEACGWKSFTINTFYKRYGVFKKTDYVQTMYLIDIESLKDCKEFQDILGYINTMEY